MLSSIFKSATGQPPWFVSNFDSATGLVRALGRCLHGKGFPGVGNLPESSLLAKLINLLPWSWQNHLYVMNSAKGTVDPSELHKVRSEAFCEWVVDLYPKKKYPAILIGSASGPAIHLAAAMGVPLLPQTFLIPVGNPRQSPDKPIEKMEWARPWAKQLLDNNPSLQLHHMMDPVQDRPMLETTSYFRVKLLQLGQAYEQFVTENLEAGGNIYILNCQKSWPVTQVDERHYFQFGGLGRFSPEEYYTGSRAVKEFLKAHRAQVEQWQAPKPEGRQPEAEWGFVPTLGEDTMRMARDKDYSHTTISFYEPEDLSPFVADLYRWWYQQRGISANKLLIEMFFLTEPYWALRTGAVPYWLAFNAQASAKDVQAYLSHREPFDEIYMLPFSNGVAGDGLATADDLKAILACANKKGAFLGAEPQKYPFDFGVYARYEKALKSKISSRYHVDEKLSHSQLKHFFKQAKSAYKVAWISQT